MKLLLAALAVLATVGCENVPYENNELVPADTNQMFTTGTYQCNIHREISDNSGWAAVEDYPAEMRVRQKQSVILVANAALDVLEDGDVVFVGKEKSTNPYTSTIEEVTFSGGIVSWLPLTVQMNFTGIIYDHDDNPVYLYWDNYTVIIGEKLFDGY